MVTKKVKSAGRFRQKYGRKIRLRITEIETEQNKPKVCPKCAFPSLKREGAGIWLCRKCGYKFAGGAYLPTTPAGSGVNLLKEEILEDAPAERKETPSSFFEESGNEEAVENA